jgi:hypothetical protein
MSKNMPIIQKYTDVGSSMPCIRWRNWESVNFCFLYCCCVDSKTNCILFVLMLSPEYRESQDSINSWLHLLYLFRNCK